MSKSTDTSRQTFVNLNSVNSAPAKQLIENSRQRTKNRQQEFLDNMPALICMSHLKWEKESNRTQQLLQRFGTHTSVFYFEEPVFYNNAKPHVELSEAWENVTIVTAHLPSNITLQETTQIHKQLIDAFLAENQPEKFVVWYNSATELEISRQLNAELIVFDCMHESAVTRFAQPAKLDLEAEMFKKADLIFTHGQHLNQGKRFYHPEIYAFPENNNANHHRPNYESGKAPELDENSSLDQTWQSMVTLIQISISEKCIF